MLYMKAVERVSPKSSQHKENIFSFSFVSIWDDACSLNFLWLSFHDRYKSNHYAIHLKLI